MYILFLSFLFTPPTEIYLDGITFQIVYLHFFFFMLNIDLGFLILLNLFIYLFIINVLNGLFLYDEVSKILRYYLKYFIFS